jgi:hypothetical protein
MTYIPRARRAWRATRFDHLRTHQLHDELNDRLNDELNDELNDGGSS